LPTDLPLLYGTRKISVAGSFPFPFRFSSVLSSTIVSVTYSQLIEGIQDVINIVNYSILNLLVYFIAVQER
jgi:hypothetical protein